jgi:hypothetical protein
MKFTILFNRGDEATVVIDEDERVVSIDFTEGHYEFSFEEFETLIDLFYKFNRIKTIR